MGGGLITPISMVSSLKMGMNDLAICKQYSHVFDNEVSCRVNTFVAVI